MITWSNSSILLLRQLKTTSRRHKSKAWTFCLACRLINDSHRAEPFSLEKKKSERWECFLLPVFKCQVFYLRSLCGSWRCRCWFNTLSGDVLACSSSQSRGFHWFFASFNRFSIEPSLCLGDNGMLIRQGSHTTITCMHMEISKMSLQLSVSISRLIYCRWQNTSGNQQVFLAPLFHL